MAISIRALCGSCLLLGAAITAFVAVVSLYVEHFIVDSDFSVDFKHSNMTEAEAIAKNQIKSATSGEVVTVESLWAENPVVITFFRRFGCAFCRVAAKDLSAIKEDLDKNNVRLIGIGVEDLGKEDFINGNFFKGDLFIDQDKKCYKDLKFKRFGILSMIPAMVHKTSRDAMSNARTEQVGGDLKGDIYQVGGTLVIGAGGKEVLLSHRQFSLADHVDPNAVLKSLGLPPKDNLEKAEKPAECKLDGSTSCE